MKNDPLVQFAYAAQVHLSTLLVAGLITEEQYNERAKLVRQSVNG